jgi:hypothetical protein
VNIFIGDTSAKLKTEDVFKPTMQNESLHELDNGVGVVNFATSRNIIVREYYVPTLQHS